MNTTSEKWNSEDPFVRRSCYDCGFLKGYLSWWCTSEAAKQDRGTSIPGCIHCPHWKPDFRVIDDRWNEFKVKENEHYKAVSIASPRTVSFWIILLLVLLAIAMGSCYEKTKATTIPPEATHVFRVDQKVSVLRDDGYCLSTIAWYDGDIISHQLTYEDPKVRSNDMSLPVQIWFVPSLNDSVKIAQRKYAESKLKAHISKISIP